MSPDHTFLLRKSRKEHLYSRLRENIYQYSQGAHLVQILWPKNLRPREGGDPTNAIKPANNTPGPVHPAPSRHLVQSLQHPAGHSGHSRSSVIVVGLKDFCHPATPNNPPLSGQGCLCSWISIPLLPLTPLCILG